MFVKYITTFVALFLSLNATLSGLGREKPVEGATQNLDGQGNPTTVSAAPEVATGANLITLPGGDTGEIFTKTKLTKFRIMLNRVGLGSFDIKFEVVFD